MMKRGASRPVHLTRCKGKSGGPFVTGGALAHISAFVIQPNQAHDAMQTHTYRGFEIETDITNPTEPDGVPELHEAVQVIGRRGRIEIVETPPLSGEKDAQLREEIDRLLDPATLRDVDALN